MQSPEFDRRRIGTYLGLGIGLAATTVLFMVVGVLLDRGVGTSPLFTVVGAFVGGALGFYYLYREAMAVEDRGDDDSDRERSEEEDRDS